MDIKRFIKVSADELLKVVSAFDQEAFNKVPFEGSWTAGQVAEHLLRACSPEALYLETTKTERAADMHFAGIEDLFLDFTTRYESPDFVRPKGIYHQHQETLDKLTASWAGIAEAADTLDLTVTCVAFEIPGFGYLTRLELIYFMACHAQRHTRQLQNIYRKVSGRNDHQPVTG
jgi:hypothetical protein